MVTCRTLLWLVVVCTTNLKITATRADADKHKLPGQGQGLGVKAGSQAEAEAAGLRAEAGCTGKFLLPVFDLYEPFPGIPAERRPGCVQAPPTY